MEISFIFRVTVNAKFNQTSSPSPFVEEKWIGTGVCLGISKYLLLSILGWDSRLRLEVVSLPKVNLIGDAPLMISKAIDLSQKTIPVVWPLRWPGRFSMTRAMQWEGLFAAFGSWDQTYSIEVWTCLLCVSILRKKIVDSVMTDHG